MRDATASTKALLKIGLGVFAIVCAIATTACSDNAVRLRFGLEAAARNLLLAPERTETRVEYEPAAARAGGYWVVFFPARHVQVEELVARGMPKLAAERIFRELAYVNVGRAPSLVVYGDAERTTFTRYDGEVDVRVHDLIVEHRTGRCSVVLEKQHGLIYVKEVM